MKYSFNCSFRAPIVLATIYSLGGQTVLVICRKKSATTSSRIYIATIFAAVFTEFITTVNNKNS